VLRRPALLPAPAVALRVMLGEMADALILTGQRVLPQRALDDGYAFTFPTLEPALRDLF
jgi:NAD dependent epimerase/dehydratase family enzyme